MCVCVCVCVGACMRASGCECTCARGHVCVYTKRPCKYVKSCVVVCVRVRGMTHGIHVLCVCVCVFRQCWLTSAGSLEWLIDGPTVACIVVSSCSVCPVELILDCASKGRTADVVIVSSLTTEAIVQHPRMCHQNHIMIICLRCLWRFTVPRQRRLQQAERSCVAVAMT